MTYPPWSQTYASEDFDRVQALASQLTEQDRRAGLAAPLFGYSQARFVDARALVESARNPGPPFLPTLAGAQARRRLVRTYGLPSADPTLAAWSRWGAYSLFRSDARLLFVDDDHDGRPVCYWTPEEEHLL